MTKLQETIAKLKSDHLHAISVVDATNEAKLVTNATGAYLAANYGSVEGYFNDLTKKVAYYRVTNKRKNGSTYKTVGIPFPVDARPEKQETPMETPHKVHTPEVMPNYFGQGLMGGLNMMDVSYKFQDYARVERECQELKAKCEKLEAANKELENTNLRNELSGEKANANVELAKTFAPMIGPLLSKILSPAGAMGMNAPAMENLSEVKHQLIETVRLTDDSLNEYLLAVIQGIATNNDFTEELITLLEKHKLII